uniref:Uncharacterized protein n=1 Tax=Rhizophora mucronata TaxID=61149 RepID=A0A2P2R1U1_RHIMU
MMLSMSCKLRRTYNSH